MLTYNLTENTGESLYICLYTNIKNDILNGRLKADSRLPSKRSLAGHLKISIVTVENAYAQLMLEGYIYSFERRGYFISSLGDIPSYTSSASGPVITPETDNPAPAVFDLVTNSIGEEKFPFSVWAKLMRRIISDQDSGLLESTPFNGAGFLRISISEYLYRFRGMTVSPDQIIIGAGTEYLYGLIVMLLGRKNIFAVEDPGYIKISRVYRANNAECRFIGIDSYGMSIDRLISSGATVAHISPSHHFPTGRVMPIKRRNEILAWAAESGKRYIIEDDYDSEFRFSGKPVQTMKSIDSNDKVIYINTFAKTISPSIRISYMILPAGLMNAFTEKLSFISCAVPGFEQHILANFISDGYFERHINRMRNYYRKLRDVIINELKSSPVGGRITISEEDAGLHFTVGVETFLSDTEIVEKALAKGIKLSCLSEYYSDPKTARHGIIVINYSGLDIDKVREAVLRLSEIFTPE